MAILTGDVKLLKSAVMADVPEGGGAPTGTAIADGVSNAIFPDISELDRAGGRVNLRKVFASIQTDTTDTYLGGNVIVADPPDDPRVAVTIFSTESVFDRRTEARDRIEAYLNRGSPWNGYLLENHIAGQRAIQLFQREGTELPPIGRTLCLVANEGLATERTQYVRVTRVASERRTFSYVNSGTVTDYPALVVTCDLSDALRQDFPGSTPNRLFTPEAGKTQVRDTVVTDAARYFGAAKTTGAIALGDVAAEVASVFSALVPSAQTETPLLDLTAGGTFETLVDAANGTVAYATSAAFNAGTVLFAGNPILPGSLTISVGGTTLVDQGGMLLDGATVVGTVNYGRGDITLANGAPTYSGNNTISFRPAAAPIRVADTTVRIPVARYAVTRLGFAVGQGLTPVYRNLFSHWEYITAGASLPIDETALVTVRYRAAGTSNAATETFTSGSLKVDLTPGFAEPIVPGSIHFTVGGKTYFDRLGSLYHDLNPLTGAATLAGAINYSTGEATLGAWVPAASNAVSLRSLLTSLDGTPVDEVTFRVPVAPVRPSSLQLLATRLTGGTLNVTADNGGLILGTDVTGSIDYATGVVRVRFGRWVTAAGNEGAIWYDANAVVNGQIFRPVPVFADTIKYNAVAYSYLPLDADQIGLDPVRLPQDGRVPIFRPGDFAVLGHTSVVGPLTVSNGQVVNCGRVRLSRVRVLGHDGGVIHTGYAVDLEAGTVTFSEVGGYAQPVTIEHRIEDMAQISDVQISGRLAFTRQITHAYPAGSMVSSALVACDLRAYVSHLFDQATWNGSFADALVGSAATATYNDVLAPIVVTNAGAITERWAIQFTATTAFNVIGEHVGVIASGTTGTDTAPLNPATGKPYFTLPALGWGSGWATGNVLRFNTVGSAFPVWVVRSVQQGPETVVEDSFTLLIRGDVDRP